MARQQPQEIPDGSTYVTTQQLGSLRLYNQRNGSWTNPLDSSTYTDPKYAVKNPQGDLVGYNLPNDIYGQAIAGNAMNNKYGDASRSSPTIVDYGTPAPTFAPPPPTVAQQIAAPPPSAPPPPTAQQAQQKAASAIAPGAAPAGTGTPTNSNPPIAAPAGGSSSTGIAAPQSRFAPTSYVMGGAGAPQGIAAAPSQFSPTSYVMGNGQTVQHLATGGIPTSAEMSPWFTRSEAHGMDHVGGLFVAPTGGRTDNLKLNVPAGSHVIPADVVSGLGEGNTMAGSAVLDHMFHTGPGGMKLHRMGGHSTMPHPPAIAKYSTGGKVPIIGAGGEFLVHPDAVKRIGGGDAKHGHNIIDSFIKIVRKKTAKKMLNLPGPKK